LVTPKRSSASLSTGHSKRSPHGLGSFMLLQAGEWKALSSHLLSASLKPTSQKLALGKSGSSMTLRRSDWWVLLLVFVPEWSCFMRNFGTTTTTAVEGSVYDFKRKLPRFIERTEAACQHGGTEAAEVPVAPPPRNRPRRLATAPPEVKQVAIDCMVRWRASLAALGPSLEGPGCLFAFPSPVAFLFYCGLSCLAFLPCPHSDPSERRALRCIV